MLWQSWVSKSPDPGQDPTVTYSAHLSSNYKKWEEAASALFDQKSYPGSISDWSLIKIWKVVLMAIVLND